MKKTVNKILTSIGFAPSENDKKMNNLVKNSYKSISVVGRGTIVVDPAEVRSTPEFQEDLKKAKAIVENSNN